MEWQQGITIGIGFCVYTVLGSVHWLYLNDIVVNMPEFQSSDLGLFPRREKYDLLFNVWYSGSFAKENNRGRHRTPHFIFMVWSALVVGGCLMVAWGRKYYLGPAEISSVVCTWLNSRIGYARWFVCICLAKPGVRWEHVIIQLSWIAAWLVVTCVCPVYLVDKLILICSVPLPSMAALPVAPLKFFKDNIMLYCFPEMKSHQGFTTEI